MEDCLNGLLHARIGEYVLLREIARATHYTLYQAVDPRVGRMVLIKLLHITEAAPGGEGTRAGATERRLVPRQEASREQSHVLAARLRREAEALALLSHPNILAVYEMGELDGYPYLVLEYLYGHPLRQHLDMRSLPMEEALGMLEQLASAIDAVHAQGILHRDIRPSNVTILHDGTVKLVDFGQARQPGDTTVTLMGQVVGEPTYMSPEQLRNQPASPESDLWALGVMLYEMLAGRPPFQGSSFPLVAHQVLMGQPVPIPGLSPAVQAVVDQALEKDPAKRYPGAAAMVGDLRCAAAHSAAPSALPPAQSVPRFALTRRATLLTAAVLGAALTLIIVLAAITFFTPPVTHAATVPPPVPVSAPAPAAPLPPAAVPPAPVQSQPFRVLPPPG